MTFDRNRFALAILALAMSLAFSISAMAQDASAPPASGSPGSSFPTGEVADSRVPTPATEKGQVIFFRAPFIVGGAVSFSVREGSIRLGELGSGSYFIYVGDPGDHTFTSRSEATDTLHMELDAGETYFVEVTVGAGFLVFRPHLTPSDAATFAKMKSLRLSTQRPSNSSSSEPKSNMASPAPGRS